MHVDASLTVQRYNNTVHAFDVLDVVHADLDGNAVAT
jgi:hypothetical protein